MSVGFVGAGLGLSAQEYLVWYVLFIVFVIYAMLPLPLRWCIILGCTTALMHIIVTSVVKFNKNMVSKIVKKKTQKGKLFFTFFFYLDSQMRVYATEYNVVALHGC